MMSSNPYFAIGYALLFIGLGTYFWLKGTGRIANTHPDYKPSLGIFKVSGVVMAISGLVVLVLAVIKLFSSAS